MSDVKGQKIVGGDLIPSKQRTGRRIDSLGLRRRTEEQLASRLKER